MKKAITFLWIFLLVLGHFGGGGREVRAAEEESEITEEDLEIIKNLEMLDSLDLLEEDLSFLEDYEDLD